MEKEVIRIAYELSVGLFDKNSDYDAALDCLTDEVCFRMNIEPDGYMFSKIRGIIERNCKF